MPTNFPTQEDVQRLVHLSEDLYRDRRERVEQIQWERQDPRIREREREREREFERLPHLHPPHPPRLIEERRRENGGWTDERIYEREVVYEDGTRRRWRVG